MNQVWLYIFLDISFLLLYKKLLLGKNNTDKLHNFVNYKIITEILKMLTLATVHLVTVTVPHHTNMGWTWYTNT
jgi:hypothetical protein